MHTIHLAQALAIVHTAGLFSWATDQANQAKTAIISIAGVVIIILAIVILIKFHHSIGKLIGGVVVLVIGGALIFGGITTGLQQQVTNQVNNGQSSGDYKISQQL